MFTSVMFVGRNMFDVPVSMMWAIVWSSMAIV